MYLQTARTVEDVLNYGILPAFDLIDEVKEELIEDASPTVNRRLTLAMGLLRRVTAKLIEIEGIPLE